MEKKEIIIGVIGAVFFFVVFFICAKACIFAQVDRLVDGMSNVITETEFSLKFRVAIRTAVFGDNSEYVEDILLFHGMDEDRHLVYHTLYINEGGGYSAYDYLLSNELTEMFNSKKIPQKDNLKVVDYDGIIVLS